jgi:hypothetical protein
MTLPHLPMPADQLYRLIWREGQNYGRITGAYQTKS